MKKVKIAAFILAVSMLAPMLMSCAKSGKKTTVTEDEPWYESERFELKTDRKPAEMLEKSVVGCSNGKIYHAYSILNLADYENYRRTMLDIYDEKGSLLNQMKVKDPDNCSIDNIISFVPDEEGKKAEAIVTLFAQGGFSTAVITIDLASGEAADPRYLTNKPGSPLEISAGGKNTYGVAEVFTAGEYNLPVIYAADSAEGTSTHVFSFKGSEYKGELDFSGIPLVYHVDEFSFDPRNNTIFTVGYTNMDGPVVLEFDPETGRRVNYSKYTAQSSDELNLSDYKAVSSGELYKIDTLGNITMFDMQTQKPVTVIDSDWYSPYFSDLSSEDVKLVMCDDDTAVIYSADSSDYPVYSFGMDETVTILKKAPKNPNAGKKILELATPIDTGISEYLSNAIYEFNKTDNEYVIRVWSKYKTGMKAGRKIATLNSEDEKIYTMIQELKGDQAPDLAVGIQKNYAMRDDVFTDLTGYLDPDVADKQFTNIIEASKIGGKQYFLPLTIEIEGLVTDVSLIEKGASGITFDEFEKMIKTKLDGFSPYDYPMSKYNYRKDFVLSCIDIKSAIEWDKVSFGSDQFRAAVEYSEKNITADGFTKPDDYNLDEEMKKVRTACRYDRLSDFMDFIRACNTEDGTYTIIGTPSLDRSGPRFRAIETISVTASSVMKDGCRKFINFVFGGTGFTGQGSSFSNIVTNKEVMTKNMSLITEKNNEEYKNSKELAEMSGMGSYMKLYGYKNATKNMEDQFIKSLSSISRYYYDDPKITAFLSEELAPYYAGDRSIEDVIKYMNDRTGKYIKEM